MCDNQKPDPLRRASAADPHTRGQYAGGQPIGRLHPHGDRVEVAPAPPKRTATPMEELLMLLRVEVDSLVANGNRLANLGDRLGAPPEHAAMEEREPHPPGLIHSFAELARELMDARVYVSNQIARLEEVI